jgi:uncharacterized protein YndB with AHSA1/START domain
MKEAAMAETAADYKSDIDRDKLEVRISRVFRATPERMWQAHTEPELLVKWWRNTKVDKFELKPGGAWRFVSTGPDGQEFTSSGEFKELDEPNKIVRTYEFRTGHAFVETTTFEPLPDGTTRQVAVSKFATIDDLNGMAKGMEYGARPGLDGLAKVVESD